MNHLMLISIYAGLGLVGLGIIFDRLGKILAELKAQTQLQASILTTLHSMEPRLMGSIARHLDSERRSRL